MTYKVVVAQLVSASGCGPEGRRFEPGLPPHFFLPVTRRCAISEPPFFIQKTLFSLKNGDSLTAYAGQIRCICRAPPELVRGGLALLDLQSALLRLAAGVPPLRVARRSPVRTRSTTPFFCLDSKTKKMNPEKASLHVPQVRFLNPPFKFAFSL